MVKAIAVLKRARGFLLRGILNIRPKRIGFVSIQMTHTIAIEGAILPAIRTGYESVIPYRTNALYTTHATQDGKVTSLTPKGIIVTYPDGTTTAAKLGRQYGRAEGYYYPHDMITHLKLGEKVKKDFPIAWNNGFFQMDFMNPGKLVLRYAAITTIALMENDATYEDSNAVTPELGHRLRTTAVKLKSSTISFKQSVHKVVKPGQTVEPTDALMYIESEVSNDLGVFDESDVKSLKRFRGAAPKAKVRGMIDRVEVIYHGELSDMTPSLRALAKQSNAMLADEFTAIGKPVMTGKVNGEYRVGGSPLAADTAEVRIYISYTDIHGTADKQVIANQMKTTTSVKLPYAVYAADGTLLAGWFSYKSFGARIVGSPIRIGTTTSLLRIGGSKMHDMYFE